MDISTLVDTLASTATFVGAVLVFLQLRIGDRQEAQALVAAYNTRYMEIAREVPLGIFTRDVTLAELGIDPQDNSSVCMRAIYEYMLLCEEQANFARSRVRGDIIRDKFTESTFLSRSADFFRLRDNRVWDEAWQEWREGMKSNMRRRAFREGAERILADLKSAGLGDDFEFVRQLLNNDQGTN